MRILFFGDSVTQGYHDEVMGGWCNRLAQYAIQKTVTSEKEYDASVFNLGISGGNTDQLAKRFAHEVSVRLEGYEGAVVFALGINDSQYELATGENRVPLDRYESNIKSCITEAKRYTDKIFIHTLLPIDESLLMPMPWKPTHGYKTEFVDMYNEKVKAIAAECDCTLIDVSNVLPETSSQYLFDGIHPTAEGHRLIYEHVKGMLETEGIL